MSTNTIYHITIQIIIGEYEKSSSMFVTGAPDKEAAQRYALAMECHGRAVFDDEHPNSRISDCGGEMAYSISEVVIVKHDDWSTLHKYFHLNEYDETVIIDVLKS